jgi:hypothetical protein
VAQTNEFLSKSGLLKEIRLKWALKSARSGKTMRIMLKPTLFVTQTDEFLSKSGLLKEIRLNRALKSAQSGKTMRIVLKPALFVTQTDEIRPKGFYFGSTACTDFNDLLGAPLRLTFCFPSSQTWFSITPI